MLTNVLRSCFSIGAKTKFEKARLQATCARDTKEPNEEDLQDILNTLNGRDMETRAQVGFATLVTKLETSESKEKWNYLLKNLIILNRCVEARFFLMDIQQLFLPSVDHFQSNDNSVRQLKIDQFVREYFQIIKKKAELYSMQNSSFNVEKSQKQKYFLKKEKPTMIFEEIQIAQKMHEFVLQIADITSQEQEQYSIIQYVIISILLFFLNLQASQYAAITVLTTKLTEMGLEQSLIFEKQFNKFLILQEKTLSFVKKHRQIPGFSDLPTDQFYQSDKRILYCIKDYQEILKTNRGSQANLYKKFKVVDIDKSNFKIELQFDDINNQQNQENQQPKQQQNQGDEISAIKQDPSTQKMLNNPEIQEISLELENSNPKKNNQNSAQHQNYFSNQTIINKINDINIDSENQIEEKQPLINKSILKNKENYQIADNNENNDEHDKGTFQQRKIQSVNFQIEKSQDTLSKNKSEFFSVGNLDNESLMMGFSQFIQKNKQLKVSRIDFERTRLQKTFIDEDENQHEFNYVLFNNYEQTWSREYQHIKNNAKLPLIKQTNSYQIQKSENDENYLNNQLGQQYLHKSENLDSKYTFQIDDDIDSDLSEKDNNQLEVLKIDVDWDKLNVFNQNLFDKFQQSFSNSSIKTTATNDTEINDNEIQVNNNAKVNKNQNQSNNNNTKKNKRKNKR